MSRKRNNNRDHFDVAGLVDAFLAKGGEVTHCPNGPKYAPATLYDYPDYKKPSSSAELFGTEWKSGDRIGLDSPVAEPKPQF